jgi:hypothetical protein
MSRSDDGCGAAIAGILFVALLLSPWFSAIETLAKMTGFVKWSFWWGLAVTATILFLVSIGFTMPYLVHAYIVILTYGVIVSTSVIEMVLKGKVLLSGGLWSYATIVYYLIISLVYIGVGVFLVVSHKGSPQSMLDTENERRRAIEQEKLEEEMTLKKKLEEEEYARALKEYEQAEKERLKELGKEGERETQYHFKFLGASYKVFNNIHIYGGGESQEFDHVVIGPTGIFHIDSKYHYGRIEVTKTGMWQNDNPLPYDPRGQASRHEYVLKQFLQMNNIEVKEGQLVGIICFSNPGAVVVGGDDDYFRIIKADMLLPTIKGNKSIEKLSQVEIDKIASLLATCPVDTEQ